MTKLILKPPNGLKSAVWKHYCSDSKINNSLFPALKELTVKSQS